jgi:hypothetical protein
MDRPISVVIESLNTERLCLEAAVEAARRNQTPARPHSQVRLEMLQKIISKS